jgi:DNA-binding NarL/FixJ family response regulator
MIIIMFFLNSIINLCGMKKIKVLIADNSYLIRRGFCSLIEESKDFLLAGEAETAEDLSEKLMLYSPDVLVIDYASRYFCIDDISVIRECYPEVKILAITYPQPKTVVSKALEYGIISYLWKDCGEEEIVEAIYSTSKNQKFLCSKVVDLLLQKSQFYVPGKVSCEGVKLSEREIEVLQSITEGLANKQIADKLFISSHTVMTHRKNIMGKLKINNMASLVMYAVRENLVNPAALNN